MKLSNTPTTRKKMKDSLFADMFMFAYRSMALGLLIVAIVRFMFLDYFGAIAGGFLFYLMLKTS